MSHQLISVDCTYMQTQGMTSAGRLLLLLLLFLLMMMMMELVAGLTCYKCIATNTKHACADPFNATGDGVERCVSASRCVTIRMTGGSLGEYLTWT